MNMRFPGATQLLPQVSNCIESGVDSVSALPPHPDPMTHSLPLVRPSRAFTFGRIPFAASQAAQVPRGEGVLVSHVSAIRRSVTQSSVGLINLWLNILIILSDAQSTDHL